MCMRACLHVYMCPCVQCSGWPVEGVTHPGTGVTSGCEAPWSRWEPEADPFSPAPYFVICIYLCVCMYVCACVCVCVHMHIPACTYHSTQVGVKGQLSGVSTLLLPWVSEIKLGHQACTASTLWVLQPALICPFPSPLDWPCIYALTALPALFILLKVFLALDQGLCPPQAHSFSHSVLVSSP